MNTKLIEAIRNVLVSGAYIRANYDGHIGAEIQHLEVIHFVGGWQVSFRIRGSLYIFNLDENHFITEDEQEKLIQTTNLQLIRVLSGQERPPFDNETDLAAYKVFLASFQQTEVLEPETVDRLVEDKQESLIETDQERPIYEDDEGLETFDGEELPC